MAFVFAVSCKKDDASATGGSNSAAFSIDSTYTSGMADGSTKTGYNEDDLVDNSTFSSTGNDAMDSNGIFTITGGKIVAVGARAPEASIDCDARTLKITGGIIAGIAGATSGPSTSASTVPSVIMGSGSAGQLIHIETSDGTEALTFLAPVSYSTLIFAGSKLKQNTGYTVYTGGEVTSGTTFNGLYTSGTYSGGTGVAIFTTNNMVTQLGGSVSRG